MYFVFFFIVIFCTLMANGLVVDYFQLTSHWEKFLSFFMIYCCFSFVLKFIFKKFGKDI